MTQQIKVPLSKSQLWQQQRDFYQEYGVDAWQNRVPYYATSNPSIANAYANIIINFIQETKFNADNKQTNVPVYIVELGTGTGTFSFYLLKRLCELASQKGLPDNAFVYVMTDMVEKNIDHWQGQVEFLEYLDKGILDFAQFDFEYDDDIELMNSEQCIGKVMQHHTLFIANYVFDTLANDVFRFSEAGLEEGLINADPNMEKQQLNKGLLLNDIKGGVSYQLAQTPYYQDETIDALLTQYQTEQQQSELVFPIGGLRMLKNLQKITQNRLLLIASDKAYSQHLDHYQPAPAKLIHHGGCFSMTVNFHAIGRYCAALHGDYFHQSVQSSILTSAFILGHNFNTLPVTQQALRNYLTLFSPGNILNLHYLIKQNRFSCSLEQIVAYLAMTHWDPHAFNAYIDAILEHIETRPVRKSTIHDLCSNMKKIAENTYGIEKRVKTLTNIGLFFQTIQKYEEALFYYRTVLEQGKSSSVLFYNMGLCYITLNQPEKALMQFNRVLQCDPDHLLARGWISQIKTKYQSKPLMNLRRIG